MQSLSLSTGVQTCYCIYFTRVLPGRECRNQCPSRKVTMNQRNQRSGISSDRDEKHRLLPTEISDGVLTVRIYNLYRGRHNLRSGPSFRPGPRRIGEESVLLFRQTPLQSVADQEEQKGLERVLLAPHVVHEFSFSTHSSSR